MSDSLTQKQVAAWRQLLVCHSRIIRLIEREFESQGLVSFTFYDILFHLRHAPNREMRFRDINGEVVLSRSALSRCLDRMAQEGLVAKLDCPEDPRGLIVQITGKGEAELKKAWPVYRHLIVNLFGRHFKEGELDFLAQRFGKVADGLENPFLA
ncbi:MAG: winged helix-turn-helix transcriptional regulator [Verrucomicrobia bacterium]|nr:winged helix-turn-helix transcriptional regulator [Verrucomicrobiota bacterium]